jgi:hypothetical protein
VVRSARRRAMRIRPVNAAIGVARKAAA